MTLAPDRIAVFGLFLVVVIGSGLGQETYRYASDASHVGIAADPNGNMFIADAGSNIVRKVTPEGRSTVYAGIGKDGFSGDGGPADRARLNEPTGLALDGAGNLYIADRWNYRIRKVTPAGIISTAAGDGSPGFTRGGVPLRVPEITLPAQIATDIIGNLFVISGNTLRRHTPAGVWTTIAGGRDQGFSGDGGPAVSAGLTVLGGIAVDGEGNIFISDWNNKRVRKIARNGIISTVAGNGKEGFSGDGGLATLAQLKSPRSLAVDSSGNLFILDGFDRIRCVSTSGIISAFAGNGIRGFSGDGGRAELAQISVTGAVGTAIAVDARGNLYIADAGNHRIRMVRDGLIFTVDSKER